MFFRVFSLFSKTLAIQVGQEEKLVQGSGVTLGLARAQGSLSLCICDAPRCECSLALSRGRMGISRDLFPSAFSVNCCPCTVLPDIHALTSVQTPAEEHGLRRAVWVHQGHSWSQRKKNKGMLSIYTA